MKNPKQESKIGKSKAFKKIVDWRAKNRFLKDQVTNLEKLKTAPIIAITSFLLKTQIIEFELKQLITAFDLHLTFTNRSQILKRKVKTPGEMDKKRMTLGILQKEINQYEGKFLENLQENLSKLIPLRNHFVHELFNPGSINELIRKSKEGLKIANKAINDTESADKFLDKHHPIHKLVNKKQKYDK